MDEREQKKLEAAAARAVIRAQAVVTAMLREYKEHTRKARAAKWAELDATVVGRGAASAGGKGASGAGTEGAG